MPPVAAQAWLLAGATATGKSAVAQILAEQLGYAALSADSQLVYRGMDIGTAKPSAAVRGNVPYFGMDLATPDQPFSVGRWLEEARRSLAMAAPSHRGVIVVGGSGLYLKALTEGLEGAAADPIQRSCWRALYEREGLAGLQNALAARDPGALAALADPHNPRRLIRALERLDAHGSPLPAPWRREALATPLPVLRLPREQLHARISRRVAQMFGQGLIEEARILRQTYPEWSPTAMQAIGYAEVFDLLDGRLTAQQAFERIAARTRQLAKRQETWFRHQARAVWIDIQDHDPPGQVAERVHAIWRQYGPATIVCS